MLMLKRETDHRGKMTGYQNQPGQKLTSKGGISSDLGGRQAKRLHIAQHQIAKCFEVVFFFPMSTRNKGVVYLQSE